MCTRIIGGGGGGGGGGGELGQEVPFSQSEPSTQSQLFSLHGPLVLQKCFLAGPTVRSWFREKKICCIIYGEYMREAAFFPGA